MKTVCKISSTVKLEYICNEFDYTKIVTGTLEVSQGRGKKKLHLEFVWNLAIDSNPIIKNRTYDKDEIQQLKSMIEFYLNLSKEVR